ncbi:MAG: RNA polymerase sigma factor, partial [Lachnospiraceae bacterium]|nr:RNA polymerase sigma factor [Lachnospiraceae bacterium]
LMLDAFAVAASGRAGFAAKSSFKTWLFGIGRNLAHKHLRKKRFTFLPINEEIAENAAYEPDKGIPELELLKNERSMMLYEALRSIHEDYRQALELIYFEEMSSEEVAKVLKKTKKQVYNLVARGKQAMKEALEKAGFKE